MLFYYSFIFCYVKSQAHRSRRHMNSILLLLSFYPTDVARKMRGFVGRGSKSLGSGRHHDSLSVGDSGILQSLLRSPYWWFYTLIPFHLIWSVIFVNNCLKCIPQIIYNKYNLCNSLCESLLCRKRFYRFFYVTNVITTHWWTQSFHLDI